MRLCKEFCPIVYFFRPKEVIIILLHYAEVSEWIISKGFIDNRPTNFIYCIKWTVHTENIFKLKCQKCNISIKTKSSAQSQMYFVIANVQIRGRSQTTFTRFGFFWPPTPLCLHFLWYKSLQKVDFFDHLPPSSCKRSLWTAP